MIENLKIVLNAAEIVVLGILIVKLYQYIQEKKKEEAES